MYSLSCIAPVAAWEASLCSPWVLYAESARIIRNEKSVRPDQLRIALCSGGDRVARDRLWFALSLPIWRFRLAGRRPSAFGGDLEAGTPKPRRYAGQSAALYAPWSHACARARPIRRPEFGHCRG